VDLAANSKEQAKIAFSFCSTFTKQLDPKAKYLKAYRDSILLDLNNSKLKVFAADDSKLDGFNASFGLIDEYHSAKNSKVRDVIKSSMGMRQNPHLCTITTAGFDKTLPCYKLRSTAIDVLNGLKEDDSMFIAIYCLDDKDDWTKEDNWVKCAPNLDVTVTYRLTNDNGLVLRYEATTDKATPINLTNHCYFNIGGYASGSVHNHELMLDADTFLPTDERLIPTGELKSVEGTAFDFRTAKPIGRDINADCDEINFAGGYDHCFNFVGGETKEPVKRAELYDSVSGRVMSVYTNQPCVQFYTGNFLTNEKYPFKGGYPQKPQSFLCLETQHMPDSINHENFTDCVLRPGEKYDYTTEYRFAVK
jgi:galactose mutarotase-like enzyme